jgi:hypothetical protein
MQAAFPSLPLPRAMSRRRDSHPQPTILAARRVPAHTRLGLDTAFGSLRCLAAPPAISPTTDAVHASGNGTAVGPRQPSRRQARYGRPAARGRPPPRASSPNPTWPRRLRASLMRVFLRTAVRDLPAWADGDGNTPGRGGRPRRALVSACSIRQHPSAPPRQASTAACATSSPCPGADRSVGRAGSGSWSLFNVHARSTSAAVSASTAIRSPSAPFVPPRGRPAARRRD